MIKELELKNFKCFNESTIPFKNLTLLSGVNGSGKSTVIQSILSIRQSFDDKLLLETGLSLNGDYVKLGRSNDVLFEDAKEDIISINMLLSNNVKASWVFDYRPELDILGRSKITSVDQSTFLESLFDDRFQYLAAERIGPRVSYSTSNFLVTQHRRLGNKGELAAHFFEVFQNKKVNDKLLHESSSKKELRNQVEAWMSEVTPGTRINVTSHAGMDLVNLEYCFVHGTELTKNFRSTNVGFGITYTLPVLLAVLSADPGDLLVLENPEAHLHPRGQRKLGELIAKASDAGVQIIVESHSDHFLNGIRIAVLEEKCSNENVQLHYFDCNRKGTSKHSTIISPNIDNKGRLDQWPDGFFDEWDKGLEKLLV